MDKKIIACVHPELDYSQFFIYTGLCELLGENKIILSPDIQHYHGKTDDWYYLDDGKKGNTAPLPFMKPTNIQGDFQTEYLVAMIKSGEIDFVLLASPRTYAVMALSKIMKEFNNKLPVPLVMMCGEDYPDLRTDLLDKFHPDILLKREYLSSGNYNYNGVKILPFPFSCPYNGMPVFKPEGMEKEYDVFFSVGRTDPKRVEIIDRLKKMDIKFAGGLEPEFRVDFNEYCRLIAKSKIAISCRGAGLDTVRFWEIPFYNTMMMAVKNDLVIPHNFEDGKHCVWIEEDLSDLEDKVIRYLMTCGERNRIAEDGHKHLITYHTNRARASQLLEIVENFQKKENPVIVGNGDGSIINLLAPYRSGHEYLLEHYDNYDYHKYKGDPRRMKMSEPDNVVGYQQRAFQIYWALECCAKSGKPGLDIGAPSQLTPYCISIDCYRGIHPYYGGDIMPVIQCQGEDLSIFGDEVFPLVTAAHSVEHLEGDVLEIFRNHWLRVLMKGGIMALIVPDNAFVDVFGLEPGHKQAWTAEQFKEQIVEPLVKEGRVELIEHSTLNNNFSFNCVMRKIK